MNINEILSISNYVAFDIETTALKPDRNFGFIIEIGAVKVENNRVIDKFSTFVRPGILIPKKITEITTIRNEDVLYADNITTTLIKLKEFIGDNKFVIGHNSKKFDWPFIQYWMEETNIIINKENIDTMLMAKELFNKEELKERESEWLKENGKNRVSYSLAALCHQYGIVDEKHHRAINDAIITHEFFQHLKNEFLNEDKQYQIDQKELYKEENFNHNLYLVSINYWSKGKLKRLYIDVTNQKGSTINIGTVFYDFDKKDWSIKQTPFPIVDFKQVETKTKKIFNSNTMDINIMQNAKLYFGKQSY